MGTQTNEALSSLLQCGLALAPASGKPLENPEPASSGRPVTPPPFDIAPVCARWGLGDLAHGWSPISWGSPTLECRPCEHHYSSSTPVSVTGPISDLNHTTQPHGNCSAKGTRSSYPARPRRRPRCRDRGTAPAPIPSEHILPIRRMDASLRQHSWTSKPKPPRNILHLPRFRR